MKTIVLEIVQNILLYKKSTNLHKNYLTFQLDEMMARSTFVVYLLQHLYIFNKIHI